MLVDEPDVNDASPACKLDQHLLAVVGPAAWKTVAPAGAGQGFPAVLGDEWILVGSPGGAARDDSAPPQRAPAGYRIWKELTCRPLMVASKNRDTGARPRSVEGRATNPQATAPAGCHFARGYRCWRRFKVGSLEPTTGAPVGSLAAGLGEDARLRSARVSPVAAE